MHDIYSNVPWIQSAYPKNNTDGHNKAIIKVFAKAWNASIISHKHKPIWQIQII